MKLLIFTIIYNLYQLLIFQFTCRFLLLLNLLSITPAYPFIFYAFLFDSVSYRILIASLFKLTRI